MRSRVSLCLLFTLLGGVGLLACDQQTPAGSEARKSGPSIQTTTFTPCLDGQVDHVNSNCLSCDDANCSANTTGNPVTVIGDKNAPSLCGRRKQMVLDFDTSILAGQPTSATLKFRVKDFGPDTDVASHILGIYKLHKGSCPTTYTCGDFVGCCTVVCGPYGSLLTTVTITGTGPQSVDVGGSSVNPDGITQYAIVDHSTYSGPLGFAQLAIRTNEDGQATLRPTLETN